MSQHNVDVIRRAVEAFNTEGPEAAGARFFADDVEFHDPPDSPSPRVASGRDAVRAQFNAFNEAWERHESEPQEIRAVGADKVLLVSIEHFTGRDGIELQATSASVFTLRDGKVVRWQTFWDRARALEAAGLANSEQNVEIVRQIFPGPLDLAALFGNADLLAATREAIEPYMEPEFETIGDPNAMPMGPSIGVEGGPRGLFAKGPDGFLDFWREWLSAWETWNLGPPEFIAVDENRVLASYEVRARSKTDQVELTIDAANLITVREGKVARLELFFNRDNALRAAGLAK